MKNDPGTLIRELTSTIRTVVDDLLTDLAETEDARRSADAKMYPGGSGGESSLSSSDWRLVISDALGRKLGEADFSLDECAARIKEMRDWPLQRENFRSRARADAIRIAKLVKERDEWRDRALQSTDHERQHGAQLPTPDDTNPAHRRWAARMIELAQPGGDLPYRASQRNILAAHLRADADRLEAAQQQADADEELIEKAAQTLAFAAERNDAGVTESEMWETYLVRESRRKYLDHARALHRAGLLQGGDEK